MRALAIAFAIVGTLVITLAVSTPASTVVAAVFPPWWDAASVFRAAATAGDPVRVARLPWIIVVRSDSTALAENLRTAGALALLDANAFGGCVALGLGR